METHTKTQMAAQTSQVIWVVNPFDQLPNESDVPLRYWALCRELAKQGHQVIWWSSDFSHLNKTKRQPCPDIDGFSVRLIQTSPYKKNISLARLKNHRQFAKGFYQQAIHALKTESTPCPSRIVVSLPPLGSAEQAFKIRDYINRKSSDTSYCEVVVDIMDAWPETFYRVLPKSIQGSFGPFIFRSLHRSAEKAYQQADRMSGVGQTYLDLAKSYGTRCHTHLCYHGTDLERFPIQKTAPHSNPRLKAVYLGAMGSGYDLVPLIETAAQWQHAETFPWQLHFAGDGPQAAQLKALCKTLGLKEDRVIWHGYLNAQEITQLLQSADLAIVPNRPETEVACPYKAAEYAAAGLPMITCLEGEFPDLLKQWNAGSSYKKSDCKSLQAAFEMYSNDLTRLRQEGAHARQMAEVLFNRESTYYKLAEFICH